MHFPGNKKNWGKFETKKIKSENSVHKGAGYIGWVKFF